MERVLTRIAVLFALVFTLNTLAAAPNAPVLSVTTNGNNVSLTWSSVSQATGYTLFYAPAPYQGSHTIESVDMGQQTSFSADLPDGAAYFVAVKAYDAQGASDYSNVGEIALGAGAEGASSFYPFATRSANGASADAYWVYRVNNGQSISASQSGYSLNLQIQDLRLTIDNQAMTRTATFGAQLSGQASGSVSTSVVEQLASLDGSTKIQSQNLNLTTQLNAQGQTIDISLAIQSNYSTPTEWFLDREDLDQLGVGYTYDEQGSIFADVGGSLRLSSSFFNQTIDIPSTRLSSPEHWEIVGYQDQITVQGITHQNIVVVERTTLIPNADVAGTLATNPTKITFWVAKGLGMVKGEGQYTIMGQSLNIELVESNLIQ